MVLAVGGIARLAQLLNKRMYCGHNGLLTAHLGFRCYDGGGCVAIIGQMQYLQKRTRKESEDETAVVSRPLIDLPTHGLCGWEGRGVSASHSLTIWVKLASVIKITEEALGYIGGGAHFSRTGLGGNAYTTLAYFCQVSGSSRL